MSSILDAVEREAGRLRDDAREEARRYLEASRRQADSLVAERQRRIAELSNEIIGKAEAVVSRLDDAAPVREGFDNLVRALGDAAERLSREAERTRPDFELRGFHETGAADAYPLPDPAQTYPANSPAPPPPLPAPAYDGGTAESWAYDPPPARGYEQVPARPTEEPQPHPARAPVFDQQPPAAAPPGPAPPRPEPPEPAPPMGALGGGDWRGNNDAKLVSIQMAAAGRTRDQIRDHLYKGMGITDSGAILDEIFGAGSAGDARVPWTTFPR